MRNIIFVWLFSFFSGIVYAQNGKEVFDFLRFPSSAHANAIGGHTVSLVESDPSLVFHNPALLGVEMDQMINLNYMHYIADINVASVIFTKAAGERNAWGVGVNFIGYGNMKKTTEDNTVIGDFSAKDICIDGFYARDLSDKWRVGVTAKFLYSVLEDYSSIGLGIDAGLSYYDSEHAFSAGFALKNVGAQVKAYDEDRQKMPWDIQLGFSKKLNHAPFRFTMTAMYLNRWKFTHIETADKEYKEDNFFKTFFKHLVIGADFIPSENFWIGIGFNPKVSADMKLQGGNAFGGFSAGAGIRIKMFDIGASVAQYHPSATSFMFSVSTRLGDFRL